MLRKMKSSLCLLKAFFLFALPAPFSLSADVTQTAPPSAEELCKVQVGNLIYGNGKKSSVCFADRFVGMATKQTHFVAGDKFIPVQLSSPELFDIPFIIFSGEGNFSLTEAERENLRTYLNSGGFILASPSCSNNQWEQSFRNELKLCLPEHSLDEIPMTHPIFNIVHKIDRLLDKKGKPAALQGMTIKGRLAVVHSPEGLNDVKYAKGCCCCGGNEIRDPAHVNINILAYAVVY